MGNIEISALIKYLWAAFIPVAMKGWAIIDTRFTDTEKRVESLVKDQSEIKTSVRVLIERSENQEKTLQRIEELLMKHLLAERKDK